MMRLDVKIEGSLADAMAGEAAAVVHGAKSAVRRQTDETKLAARRVVSLGLNKRGRGRVENTIRGRVYEDTPAGFVHSTWGYFDRGAFVDILAAHETGATITPRRGQYLFIPFERGARRRFKNARRGQVEFIPSADGLLVLLVSARGRQRVLGELVRQVRLPKRLDFRQVEARAESGLEEKTLLDIEIAAQRLASTR
jgi:hypothetical protein